MKRFAHWIIDVIDDYYEIILFFIIIGGIVAIALACSSIKSFDEKDREEYNNNVCIVCGEEEAFDRPLQITHSSSGSRYYYECKKCGNVIELRKSRQKIELETDKTS